MISSAAHSLDTACCSSDRSPAWPEGDFAAPPPLNAAPVASSSILFAARALHCFWASELARREKRRTRRRSAVKTAESRAMLAMSRSRIELLLALKNMTVGEEGLGRVMVAVVAVMMMVMTTYFWVMEQRESILRYLRIFLAVKLLAGEASACMHIVTGTSPRIW